MSCHLYRLSQYLDPRWA